MGNLSILNFPIIPIILKTPITLNPPISLNSPSSNSKDNIS